MGTIAIQADQAGPAHAVEVQTAGFHALEQRVLRAIELLRTERELRTIAEQRAQAAEAHFVELEMRVEQQSSHLAEVMAHSENQGAQLAEKAEQIRQLEDSIAQMGSEREQVRERVERLLQHLDEFTE
jgi:chromosome segregation ATPase